MNETERPNEAGFLPPLCDEPAQLRQLARWRLRRDQMTRGQVQLGDALADYLYRHLSPEEAETAGRALLVTAGSMAGLITEGVERPEIICNIIGFAAGRMIADGRAWQQAGVAEDQAGGAR